MSTPTDSVLARAILDAADRRAGQLLDRAIPQVRYGTVTAVDVANRLASVQLPGSATASPGFAFARREVPVVGELVRVVILPTGDRYIDASYGPPAAVGAIVFHSTTESTTTAVSLTLAFDSETSDPYAFHSTTVNTSRLTVPSGMAGVYMVIGHVTYAANGTGLRMIILLKNGAEVTRVQAAAATGDRTHVDLSFPVVLADADYVQIQAHQSSGGILNVGSATAALANKFTLYRLG